MKIFSARIEKYVLFDRVTENIKQGTESLFIENQAMFVTIEDPCVIFMFFFFSCN